MSYQSTFSNLSSEESPLLEDEINIQASIARQLDIPDLINEASNKKLSFGIDFLDDSLIGLLPNDLMLIGAKSGLGKTQIATQIAGYNCNMGKNVFYLALEAEESEIEMRLKYTILAGLFFKDGNRQKDYVMTYRNWRFGIGRETLSRYEEEASYIFVQKYARLSTAYRRKGFGLRTLERLFEYVKDKKYDLLIMDHLHYFDTHSDRENFEISQIVKKIRELNLFCQIPTVLIAHLRKDLAGTIPDLNDFMGSSDIGKVATIACMISKDNERTDIKNGNFSTAISIPKARTGNPGVVGLVKYSVAAQSYLTGYDLARPNLKGDKLERIKVEDYPKWARAPKSNLITLEDGRPDGGY